MLVICYIHHMVKEVSIVIPAYNEEGSVATVLEGVVHEVDELGLTAEVLVVNDASKDGTARIVDDIAKSNPDIRLISHSANRGYGASLKTGILEAKYDTIVVIDADCTYPITSLKSLLEEMDGADMVVGARTGGNVNIEKLRVPAKWFLGKLASVLAEQDIPDLNSGFRAFNREIALSYFHLLPNKFSFTTTITLAMMADGFTVHYVPIDYYARKGHSKITPKFAWDLMILIVRTIFYFNPLKIILPIAFSFGLLGMGKLIYDVSILSNLTDTTVLLLLFSFQMFGFGLLADLVTKRT